MSAELPIYAGVDGGGTSTRVAVASADGSICGVGTGPASNPHEVGLSGLSQALKAAFADAWAAAGRNPQPLDGVFLGIAGLHALGNPNVARDSLAARAALGPNARVEADHDLRSALAGALAGQPGIVLVAGTGSCAYGRNQAGQDGLCGGWGALLDDTGGGYGLALQAMRAGVRGLDGRDAVTSLGRELLDFFQVKEPRGLVAKTQRLSRSEIAAFAPRVLALAQGSDAAALRIVESGAAELATMARVLAERLFPGSDVPVALAGGLSHNSHYVSRISAAMHAQGSLRLADSQHSPVAGALLLAFGLGGREAPAGLLRRVDQQLSSRRAGA